MGNLDFLGNIGGSVVSSIAGLFSANRQNKLALKMQREQNEWNNQQRIAQNNWNLQMWNRENEYNSALAQRQRLDAAGLNPYMMLNGGDAGSASSLTGQPATTSLGVGPSTYNPASDLNQAFMQMSDQLFKRDNVAADTASKIADAKSKLSVALLNNFVKSSGEKKLPYELNLLDSQAMLNDSSRSLQRVQEQSEFENSLLKSAQRIGQNLINQKDSIFLKYFDQSQQVDIASKLGLIAYYAANTNLSKQQLKYVFSQTIGQNIANNISQKNYEKIEANFQDAVNAEKWQLRLEGLAKETEYWRNKPQLDILKDKKVQKNRSNRTYSGLKLATQEMGDMLRNLFGGILTISQ